MQYPASCFWDYIHIYRSRVGEHATGDRALVGGTWLTVCVLYIPVACKDCRFDYMAEIGYQSPFYVQ